MYVVFASCGNDSVALIQWVIERELADCHVVHSQTGWAHPEWGERVGAVAAHCQRHQIPFHELSSEGLLPLVRRKKGWPRQGIQFCTQELKIKPALMWLDEHDPNKEAVCLVGVRREESANRAQFPEWTEDSPKHGGRDCWAPLVRFREEARDALILRAGFEVLPHRSMECWPCINSNRSDLRTVTEDRIRIIERTEKELGVSPKTGKPKTMFRPYRHQGAVGIREVIRWANSDRGKYEPVGDCEGGWCGD